MCNALRAGRDCASLPWAVQLEASFSCASLDVLTGWLHKSFVNSEAHLAFKTTYPRRTWEILDVTSNQVVPCLIINYWYFGAKF